jgi:hypothetical protein
MICKNRKIIFIHIPKTGGSSMEDMLWAYPRHVSDLWMGTVRPGYNKYQSGGLQHLTALQIRQEVGHEIFNASFKFALVRNPVDRLISQFNYLNRRKDLLNKLQLGPNRDFSDYLSRIQDVEHVQWKKQSEFVLDGDGSLIPEVYQLETIDQRFTALAAKLGLTAKQLIHTNAFGDTEAKEDWVIVKRDKLTQSQLDEIYRLYNEDFVLFGYPKPE